MGSQIESGLKKAKSQKMKYFLHENLNFEGPGLQTRVQNGSKMFFFFSAGPLRSVRVFSL